MNKHTYKSVIALGFKRDESALYNVFFDKNGYKYFFCAYKINRKYSLEWDCESRLVTLYKEHKTFKKDLSIDEIKEYIKLLK